MKEDTQGPIPQPFQLNNIFFPLKAPIVLFYKPQSNLYMFYNTNF